ncbi:hypothetical protein [Nitratiruptor sp. YY09-18]|uniref:hypothetical protein n=1 Tax=Nitratiruptor sp. YY09-18 TaxID=2724901 RepID=UPI00191654E6|nr:hypothetical protein [Nitratiruptor sp. YY09-18]BCD68891.1 hypothetical protein NitYY0918_C1810 [Nitratiruptor sp. YY09-18]
MFNISKDFAPPFSLIVPFFIAGVLFFVASAIALLFYTPHFSYLELKVAGWVHLFLVGYVMMIIFGAMAQLVPVVLETGHFSVDWYYLLFPILLVGVLGLVSGFWLSPLLLSFGGLLVLVAMIIFAVEVMLTVKKSTINTFTMQAVKYSNIFLLVGILSGFLMALTLSGFMGVRVESVLKFHVFAVLGGYVLLTIYGISLVLLPMFGLAHGFDEKPVRYAMWSMVAAVVTLFFGVLFAWHFLQVVGYLLGFVSVALYFYQVYLIYKTRVRKEREIWYMSMLFGYGSFAFAFLLGVLYLLSGMESERFLYSGVWFLFVFFMFLINGHLYKIVPFLVWFHRFSELVGKQKVPMLHEMYPKKQASFEFWFTAIGSLLVGLGLLVQSGQIFKAGGSFLVVGALFLLSSLFWMIKFRSENG